MIPLHGRPTTTRWSTLDSDVWRVVDAEGVAPLVDEVRTAVLLAQGESEPPPGASLYLSRTAELAGPGPTLHLPPQLSHVAAGDVLVVAEDGSRVDVVWKGSAVHNSLLLTERCDNYCIMCSQPPKDRDDSYLYRRAARVIDALPAAARSLALTGGEPTLDAERFLGLLRHCAVTAPQLGVHVLSNGRRFADADFTAAYGRIPITDLMVGIPLYAAEARVHDYVVQAPGAFNETLEGILNLASVGARIEIRVVLQQQTIPVLGELALFICRNLPFIDQVALMGLEMTGLARPNSSLVWIDPADYQSELREAFTMLDLAGVATHIYNHQLCVLDRTLWRASVRSISDWKNDYPDMCEPCVVRDSCAGVFTTSGNRLSAHLRPVLAG